MRSAHDPITEDASLVVDVLQDSCLDLDKVSLHQRFAGSQNRAQSRAIEGGTLGLRSAIHSRLRQGFSLGQCRTEAAGCEGFRV